MMRINDIDMKTKIDVELNDGLNAIIDNSGTGKTYLMSLISSYCVCHNIPYLLINSSNYEVTPPDGNYTIILLDNVNLYGTSEYLTKCCDIAPYVLCSSKTLPDVFGHKMTLSSLQHNAGTLEVKPYDVYI